MAVLTSDFLENRRKSFRYRKFILPVGIFLVVAASLAAGFYLYEKDESKNSPAVAGAEETTAAGLLPKEWLLKYFGTEDENDPRIGGLDGDPDEDILTNEQEFYFGTDPTNPDSDGDGQYDGVEIAINSNPLGEGELYNTDFARQIADQYLETNQLEEFKKENIEKQITEILKPPDPSTIVVQLPDPKTLKVSNANTPESADGYFKAMNDESIDLDIGSEVIKQVLANSGGLDANLTLAKVYDTVNRLRAIEVPSDFLMIHQLYLAGLFASANILELSKTIDPLAPAEAQKDKIQEQYRNVAVIQKIDSLLRQEIEKLLPKYQEVIQKYVR